MRVMNSWNALPPHVVDMQCVQEQTGQTLDGYGRMKFSSNKASNLKYKYKYCVLTTVSVVYVLLLNNMIRYECNDIT